MEEILAVLKYKWNFAGATSDGNINKNIFLNKLPSMFILCKVGDVYVRVLLCLFIITISTIANMTNKLLTTLHKHNCTLSRSQLITPFPFLPLHVHLQMKCIEYHCHTTRSLVLITSMHHSSMLVSHYQCSLDCLLKYLM